MKEILKKAFDGQVLGEFDIHQALTEITSGKASPEQAAALLGAISARGETPEELAAFALFMRQKAKLLSFQSNTALIDVCGTGGDCSGTFNISTVVSFVIAGAGAKVVKHGNRSVSSQSGSADVLEQLGILKEIPGEKIQKILDEIGMIFLFAPNYHQSMAKIKEIRKAIGVPTIFNLLGPLVNPANPEHQIIGVYDNDKCEIVAKALLILGTKEAMVVYGTDGLDEFSTTGANIYYHIKDGKITKKCLSPEEIGIKKAQINDLAGGDAEQNAQIILEILSGAKGSKRDIVLLNSAAALIVSGIACDFEDGIIKAAASIDSGVALRVLEKLKNVSG